MAAKAGVKAARKQGKKMKSKGGPKGPLNSWMAFRKYYIMACSEHAEDDIQGHDDFKIAFLSVHLCKWVVSVDLWMGCYGGHKTGMGMALDWNRSTISSQEYLCLAKSKQGSEYHCEKSMHNSSHVSDLNALLHHATSEV
jgi:hypothetical protein